MEINILFDAGLEDCLDAGWIQSIAEQALVAQGVGDDVEMGLVIASQQRVQELNKTYRGKDEPTDVLAFAMLPESSAEQESSFATPPDGMKHLGEVIIGYPQAVKQAEEHMHSIAREVAILIIHGVLHLLGYDHNEPEPAHQMAAREAAILDIVEGGLD
jgi:probable rRNA maturation factor